MEGASRTRSRQNRGITAVPSIGGLLPAGRLTGGHFKGQAGERSFTYFSIPCGHAGGWKKRGKRVEFGEKCAAGYLQDSQAAANCAKSRLCRWCRDSVHRPATGLAAPGAPGGWQEGGGRLEYWEPAACVRKNPGFTRGFGASGAIEPESESAPCRI